MYYRYFGLVEAPFSIAVNPRYLFMSARHRDALAHLLYGVGEGGGFVLLTGEVGTGKTTIIRSLLDQLPENTDIALVFNPALDARELLAAVCDELGIAYSQQGNSLKNLTDILHRFLLDNHARGRHTVLLIDEAQHLKVEVLEQIRLLTNLETNTKKLLQIILVGQPELRALLNKPELRQLAQRITARYQLKPLTPQEADDYIRHRLHVAGLPASQRLFPRTIVKAIHRASRGVPRLINVLCDRMLLGTYGQNKTVVDRVMFRQALTEVVGEEEELQVARNRRSQPVIAALVTGCAVLAGLLFWQYNTASLPKGPPMITTTNNVAPNVTPAITGVVAAAPTAVAATIPWLDSEAAAVTELLQVIGVQVTGAEQSGITDCNVSRSMPLRCERLTVESWQELRSYNRPAVLKLITRAKMLRYAVVIGFDSDNAFIRLNGETISTPIIDLGEQWTGEMLFFWQASEHYAGPVALNDSGPMVNWLAAQFASLDQQDSALAETRFNSALQQRVMIFQQNHQLKDDGVVGLKTLLKLNEQLTQPVTLISSLPHVATRQGDTDNGEG